jgi:hypothetical protein
MTARKPADSGKGDRADRLAAALKQNLRRRKAQARGRTPEKAADTAEQGEPEAERPADDQDR